MVPGLVEGILILVLVAVFFGAGKLPQVMEAMGKGAKEFRKGLEDEEEAEDEDPPAP